MGRVWCGKLQDMMKYIYVYICDNLIRMSQENDDMGMNEILTYLAGVAPAAYST